MNAQLADWLRLHPGPLCAVHDYDADGISAAALWWRATGGSLRITHSRQTLPALTEGVQGVFLLDLSCPEVSFPWTQPSVVIDHHPTAQQPPEALIFDGHTAEPRTCTSLMVQSLFWPDSLEHAWLAALGALSDLGEPSWFPVVAHSLKTYGKGRMRELVSLINSAHRSEGDCQQAVRALLEHESPVDLAHSEADCVHYLRECREKVRHRLGQARQIQPRHHGGISVIEFSADCPVQSLVAQVWRNRLPGKIVVAANRRCDRDEVQVSARARETSQMLDRLHRLGLPVQGHPASAGGVFSREVWDRFMKGFVRA